METKMVVVTVEDVDADTLMDVMDAGVGAKHKHLFSSVFIKKEASRGFFFCDLSI
jgi:hypothetical protein